MSRLDLLAVQILLLTGLAMPLLGQEKTPPETPKPANLLAELKGSPDGILRVATNADGSFQSLAVKATVKTDDGTGGKQTALALRNEAEGLCKKSLAKWLGDNCDILEAADKTLTLQTKGNGGGNGGADGAKDAAGNAVKLVRPPGQEFQVVTLPFAKSTKGLTVAGKDATNEGKDFVLIMSLTPKSMTEGRAFVESREKAKPTENKN